MHKENTIWEFFASVKLALVTISLLAITSIIGTIVLQNQPADYYVKEYGQQMARLFLVLDIPDMYRSWWFLALLALLSCNLIVCSIDRFPMAWKQITADGLKWNEQRLATMSNRVGWEVPSPVAETTKMISDTLAASRWPTVTRTTDGQTLLFSQKGAWTRIGVYIVHSSILIIFLGGIIGSTAGFKGSMLIPETMEENRIALSGKQGYRDLDFTVRCNSFGVDFYPNGAPKEFVSNLTIIENGQPVLSRDIEVNDPLTYHGVTFYQSSYQAFNDFLLTITDTTTGTVRSFTVPFQQQEQWPETGLRFGIINAKSTGQELASSKLWISGGSSPPITRWIDKGATVPISIGDRSYHVSVKQLYATGLQVVKDPGVWLVYTGCILMLLGLAIAFFMSHRRLWLQLSPSDSGTRILLAGSANKNRPGFTRTFEELAASLQNRQA